MREYIARVIQNEYTPERLKGLLNLKAEDIRERLKQGEPIKPIVYSGLLDDLTPLITSKSVDNVHRGCLILGFVTKIESSGSSAHKDGDPSLPFFEGAVGAILEALETFKDSGLSVIHRLWDVLEHVLSFLTAPVNGPPDQPPSSIQWTSRMQSMNGDHRDSLFSRANKRLMTTVFGSIIKFNEDSESVLLLVMQWLLSTRTFDSKRNEDIIYLTQLNRLHMAVDDRISRGGSLLVLENLGKLARRNEATIPFFVSTRIKYMNDEMSTGGDVVPFRIQRTLELLTLLLEKGEPKGGVLVPLNELWKVFHRILGNVKTNDVLASGHNVVSRVIRLVTILAHYMGPDLFLVNISYVASLFSHFRNEEAVRQYGDLVAECITDLRTICPDLYLALEPLYDFSKSLVEAFTSTPGVSLDVLINALKIQAALVGPSVGAKTEALITRLVKMANHSLEGNGNFIASVSSLIDAHLATCCSNHPTFLREVLHVLLKWETTHIHTCKRLEPLIRTIRKRLNGIGDAVYSDPNYEEYASALQAHFACTTSQNPMLHATSVASPVDEVECSNAEMVQAEMSKEDELEVERIKQSLKRMRNFKV